MKSLTKKAWQGMLGTRINDLMVQLDGEIAELETKKTKYVISQQIVDELKKESIQGGVLYVIRHLIFHLLIG